MKEVLLICFQAIFWAWNITFLVIVYVGILPFIAPALIVATVTGQIPLEFFLTLVTLLAVPTVCTAIGAWRFRHRPLELIRLFYGVEAPLFLLCLIRLFLLRELTPASNLVLGTIVASILAFSLELLYGYAGQETNRGRYAKALLTLQIICHSLMLLVGIYAGILLLFYAVPSASVLLVGFFSFGWVKPLWEVFAWSFWSIFWYVPIFLIFFAFTASLFLAMPSALAALYIQSGRRILLAFASQHGRIRAFASAVGVVTAWIILFTTFQEQPQVQAFKLLENPPQTDSAKAALVAKSDVIRDGLLNAYLSSYRYLSTREDNNHIREMNKSVFGLSDTDAQFIQNIYNNLMSPFLYDGKQSDKQKAQKLYEQFFDTPIQKAERKFIQHALQSTYNQDEAKAGLLNINEEKVWLGKQQVTVKPQGDWAEVELYEVYENQTNNDQEVFYSFSLPESAALTGVWLGESEKLSDRFVFTVSPRGAAQKVYNEQVRQRVDPALLEQVGPRHYRLRVFPIPRKLQLDLPAQQRQALQQRKMHLWLTYKVMQQDGKWPLPQLAEKRNVFWTRKTQRIYQTADVQQKTVKVKNDWLPPFIAATQQQPTLHQVNLPGGYQITAKPLANSDYSLPQGKRFALVLDSSRSMAAHTKQLNETFKWLRENGFADNSFTNNDADLYISASVGAKPQRIDDIRKFDPAKQTFFGSIQLQEILQQFAQLRGNTAYDGILLVTDEGSYELSKDSKVVPQIAAPLWMVHLGGQLPAAYDDATLKAIQDSGGGVSTEIPEMMQRLATKTALGSSVVSVVDSYAWYVEKNATEAVADQANNSIQPAKDGFEPLAARQLVYRLSKDTKLNQPVQLDAIHAIAKNFDIVTPYSSMIVLVNDQQRQALKQAEAQSDRFDRTVESGTEQLTEPFNPFGGASTVSGTPEPEEWMLIGLGAIALLFLGIRKYRTANS